jgi:hypothetical protein
MKNRKRWIWILIAAAVAGILAAAQYALSDRRSLEVALKVDRLPWSVRNEAVRVDSWTDYSVAGYFEADPEDLRQLLTCRPYVEAAPHGEFGFLSKPPFDFFPELNPFKVAHLFEWEMEEPSAVCRIWTNQEFTKAFVSYAAD